MKVHPKIMLKLMDIHGFVLVATEPFGPVVSDYMECNDY